MTSSTTETPKNIDVYSIVTNQIISFLQQGSIPWHRSWPDRKPPRNLLSNQPYRGINVWLLLSTKYEHNLFLSWDQLKSVGGSVKRGEQGHVVVYSKKYTTDEAGKQIPLLRYYKVFNIAQCTGIPSSLIPNSVIQERDPLTCAEAVVQQMASCPPIKHRKQRAFYDPGTDIVNMFGQKTCAIPAAYYRALFQQLIHSTGHASRLNRPTIAGMLEFGSDPYSLESIIAELGACYLCSHCGLGHADAKFDLVYLESWTGMLMGDKALIVSASTQAQRAVDYILNYSPDRAERQKAEGGAPGQEGI